MYEKYIKRSLDIIGSSVLIILLSPILIIFVIIIAVNIGTPVFFTQYRAGKNDEIFKLIKFRSMNDKKDKHGDLLPDNMRITKIGKFIRKTSIDELPELINIFKGDMSFIGPRPLSIHYLPSYTKEERIRHEVLPGLTGLAQINGRNNLDWEKRLKIDKKYVEELSLVLDIKIFILTIYEVFKQSDVVIRNDDPMKNFNVYKKVEEEKNIVKSIRNEIGSDFEASKPRWDAQPSIYDFLVENRDDYMFTLSGRSAIRYAINDVLRTKHINSVYMPSYSCVSMIQPFLDNDIEVEFYEVELINDELTFNIDIDKNVDMFFYMEYFGTRILTDDFEQILKHYKDKDTTIVEDITHSLFKESPFKHLNDYSIASIRKWFAIASGGIVYKHNGEFEKYAYLNSDDATSIKWKSMKLKNDYLNQRHNNKENFLKMMGDYSNSLIRLDNRFTIDNRSLTYLKNTSVTPITEARRKNAEYIYKNLRETKLIKFLFDKQTLLQNNPMFVPIVVSEEYRDDLRLYLINKQIYLPVHWPEEFGENNVIQKKELSIVIDQRYTENDMQRIINAISTWEDNNEK